MLVVIEFEENCFEVGCFGGSFGFVVEVVINLVDLGEEGVDSKVTYL